MPVRAGLVLGAELWPWSSAACHCGAKEQNEYLTPQPWRRRFGALKLQKSGGRFTTSSKVPVPSDHKSPLPNGNARNRLLRLSIRLIKILTEIRKLQTT
jgi:hypothetical protein